MCVVSMVMDHYNKKFFEFEQPKRLDYPQMFPQPGTHGITITQGLPEKDLKEIRELIKEFREAVKAARTVDKLTKQPDCEDPEKAKLEKRVSQLEKRLAALEPKKKTNANKKTSQVR